MTKEDIEVGECDTLEFKERLSDNSIKWLKTVVAFANGRGGRIVFGVDDRHRVKGLDGDLFALKDSIVDAIANSCEPSIPMSIGVSCVEEHEVIELEIGEGRNTPYFIKAQGPIDGVYVRYDATTRRADTLAIKDLMVNGSGKGYDQYECRGLAVGDSEIAGVCARMYEIAKSNSANEEVARLVKPAGKVQLLKWGVLLQDGEALRATNAFALLSGSGFFPVETKCAVFRGKTRDVFLDRRIFRGPVAEQVEESFKYVLSKINLGSQIKGLYREDAYEIPPAAIRELIVNAVVHRNYIDGDASAVSISLYDDRLEVVSPGRLPYGVTVKKMLTGYSECRNKALAQAFAYMNLIENWGTGIPRIVERVRSFGLRDIVIEEWSTAVRAVIYRPLPSVISAIEAKEGANGTNAVSIKDLAYNWIEAHPGVSRKILAAAINCPLRSVQRAIDELITQRRIVSRGKTKSQGYYVV